MADEKLYDLIVSAEKTVKMKIKKYGEIASTRVQPTAAFQGIFVRSGAVTLWVSDDPRRICTRIMASVPVANVRLNVESVRGPGDDFWVKPGKE
jgi:hypothetical protein